MSQAAPAAGAPAPGGSSSNGAAPGGPGPTGESGPGFDPRAAIAEIRKARGETQQLKTAFDSHRTEAAGDRETLQRLKAALSPETGTPAGPDPIAALEGQMDSFLEQAMELKAKGQQIPLTTQIALNFYQSQIENLKVIADLKKQIGDLKGGVDRANDPEAPVNNIAYTQMDTFLQQSLDNLYGTNPEQLKTKRRVYATVTEALSEDLKALQKSAPAQWDMLRRNPMKLQQVVNDVLRTIVPPKAMQMIEQEELENTPQSAGELWGAFREAQALFKNAKNDDQKQKALGLQRQIRQEILDLDKNKSKRRPRQ